MQTLSIVIICVLAAALSVKSVIVLGKAAPWTSAGWWLTIVYLAAVIAKAGLRSPIPSSAEYTVLVLLTAAFVVAGVRDERQAEPWYWPSHAGPTRAEKRRAG